VGLAMILSKLSILLICLFPAFARAQVWYRPEEIVFSTAIGLTWVGVTVEENGGESAIHTQDRTGFWGGGRAEYALNNMFAMNVGAFLEHSRFSVTHSVSDAAFVAEFENHVWFLDVPVGVRLNPIPHRSLYFPLALGPKFKLSDEVEIKRCTGLCSSESAVKSMLWFTEAGIGWALPRWDFELLYTWGLADQFEGSSTDLRIRGYRLSIAYRW